MFRLRPTNFSKVGRFKEEVKSTRIMTWKKKGRREDMKIRKFSLFSLRDGGKFSTADGLEISAELLAADIEI